MVVRDKFPDRFLDVHEALFALRHDHGGHLRDEARGAARCSRRTASTPTPCSREIDGGDPLATVQAAHEAAAKDHHVWGVPTFIVGDQAVFVRFMDRPEGDAERAIGHDRADPRPARRAGPTSTSSSTPRSRADPPAVLAFAAMAGPREMRNDRRMTDVEALMWNLEKDPHLSSSIANVTLLDQAPDPERLRAPARAGRRCRCPGCASAWCPRSAGWPRRSGATTPTSTSTTTSAGRRCPRPGRCASCSTSPPRSCGTPFDRTRPLWEFLIVEGLEDGRAAMIQKLHHTITDGEGSIRMSEQFIDLARDATEPIAPDRPGARADRRPASSRPPSTRSPTSCAAASASPAAPPRAASACCATRAGSSALAGDARRARAVGHAPGASCPTRPAHRCGRERSLRRRLEVLQVPARRRQGGRQGSWAAASTTSSWPAPPAAPAPTTARLGEPVDELRISMPVSTRTDGSAGGNAFTPTRVLVPAGIEDPAERFTAIRERLDTTKREQAMGLVSGVAGVANLLPTSVAVRFARQQVETVDFTTSNVRGAPFPLYIAGARILANYPVGPVRRHGVEPHAHVLRRPPRHGPQLRHRRRRRPGAAARPHRGRSTRRCSSRAPRSQPARERTKKAAPKPAATASEAR